MRPITLLALAGLLAACGSTPPTRYYTLTTTDGPVLAATRGAQIRVDAVTIPAELDRPQLVRQTDATRVEVASLDRWAAPVDEQIRRVLASDLTRRLPGRVLGVGAPAVPAGTLAVAVDIDRFEGGPDGHVVLEASWSLVADGQARLRRSERVEAEAGAADIDRMPGAMSEALGRLADRIARQIADSADR